MKTAVDLLIERLAENEILHSSDIEQAKLIEKQQLIDFAYKISNDLAYGSKKVIEEMYNETFKNTEK